MDYSLDEQQTEVRDLAVAVIGRRAADDAATPVGPAWFDRTLWADLGRAGLLGIAVPESQGGSGATFVEQCLVIEAGARAAARVPLIEVCVLAALPISRFGTTEQQTRLVAPFCAGELVLAGAIRTKADRTQPLVAVEAPMGWQLSGTLSHVFLADVAERILVSAKDATGLPGWFLVDPQSPGVQLLQQSAVDRAPRWQVILDCVEIDAKDVLVAPGEAGIEVDRWIDDHGVAARCVSQLGSADAALRMTATYVTEREQFGVPVGSFQGVAHRVADAYIDLTAVRLTAWRAAWLLAQGEPATEALAVAAWWAADAPSRIGESAMHLHGGISVDLDYPLHRHYLALRQGELALGGPSRRLDAIGNLIAVAS